VEEDEEGRGRKMELIGVEGRPEATPVGELAFDFI